MQNPGAQVLPVGFRGSYEVPALKHGILVIFPQSLLWLVKQGFLALTPCPSSGQTELVELTVGLG